MKRNNIWNRLFHKSEIKKNKEKMTIYKNQLNAGQYLIDSIKETKSLYTLLQIHKTAWRAEFQNINLAPCTYGMFRTNDILKMTPDEVYLGNIYGLNTHNIPFWADHKEDKYGVNGFGIRTDTLTYDIVLNQYKNILLHNIKALLEKAQKEYPRYKRLGY